MILRELKAQGAQRLMIIFTLEIPVSTKSQAAISAALSSLVGPIGSSAGCLDCRLFQELGEHQVLILHQMWKSEETLKAHLSSENCRRILEVIERAGKSPKIEFHDIARSRGLEFIEAVRLTE